MRLCWLGSCRHQHYSVSSDQWGVPRCFVSYSSLNSMYSFCTLECEVQTYKKEAVWGNRLSQGRRVKEAEFKTYFCHQLGTSHFLSTNRNKNNAHFSCIQDWRESCSGKRTSSTVWVLAFHLPLWASASHLPTGNNNPPRALGSSGKGTGVSAQ